VLFKIYKLSSGYRERRKATPKTYFAFFLTVILYVLAYGMPTTSFKLLLIFFGPYCRICGFNF